MTSGSDLDVAIAAVRRAGAILLEHHGRVTVETKSSATDVVTEADRAAEAAVVELLRAQRPADGVLGEEGAAYAGAREWTVDALDGTLNFTLGLPDWCATVALRDEHGALVASAIFQPARDELYAAARGEGATCNGAPLRVRGPGDPRAATVATWLHPGQLAGPHGARTREVLARIGSVRILGSGSMELAHVAAGRLHGWFQHDPKPWDWRPGALLVAEAGGVTRITDDGWHLAGNAELVDALA